MSGKSRKKSFEILLQIKERLNRELRLRTQRRLKELLEPEQLAVTEDESNSDDSELEEVYTDKSTVAVSSQKFLILIICSILIAVLAYLS